MAVLMENSDINIVTANLSDGVIFGNVGQSGPEYYTNTLHTIAMNTRETEFGSLVEPIPITLKAYNPLQAFSHVANGYGYPQSVITPVSSVARVETKNSSTSVIRPIISNSSPNVARPPKKKWIKEYLEEEPKSPVTLQVSVTRSIGVIRPPSPGSVAALAPSPALAPAAAPVPPLAPALPLEPVQQPSASILDFAQEHSRTRTTSNAGTAQIPSPPSVSNSSSGSSSSVPRAGTREVHNKLEKNRRAHLKECFELLKRQLPATPDDKKTSNLSILGSAIRYIQVLRRKERECEHEMERLAREKIAAQQRLAALKREVSTRATTSHRPRTIDTATEEKDESITGIPISITSSPPRSAALAETSPPRTWNLTTKLRTLPIQIAPTTSQVVRTSYGARHNTLTLTSIAPAESTAQKTQENGILASSNSLSSIVQPTQIHLPISQVVGNGGLMVSPATIQLLSTTGGLRVLQSPTVHTNDCGEENGVGAGSVLMNGLSPLVVSQSATHTHLLQAHTLTHKMVEAQMVKGSVAPLTVSAQYLSATTIVKPMVVVTSAHSSKPST
ncbi:max-binding protein MNT-like isoform X2 [Leptidea sinapis]|uniref:max-binding protein MNT-like isoform X2 n=1 Tax=Leptidea sinapis TaxID=189913 RepID=UPI0021C485D8|nr:max-binding protein MNT-like isoform X2 [Leptidea sinapis]